MHLSQRPGGAGWKEDEQGQSNEGASVSLGAFRGTPRAGLHNHERKHGHFSCHSSGEPVLC